MKLVTLITAAALAFAPMTALAQEKKGKDEKQRAGAPLEEGAAIPLGAIPEGVIVGTGALFGAVVLCVIFCFDDDPTPSTNTTADSS